MIGIDVIRAGHEQFVAGASLPNNRRGIGIRSVLQGGQAAILLPKHLAVGGIQRGDVRATLRHARDEKAAFPQTRRGTHTEGNVVRAEILGEVACPNLFARGIEANEVARAKKRPHMFLIRHGRGSGGVMPVGIKILRALRGQCPAGHLAPPCFLAAGLVEGDHPQREILRLRGEINALGRDHRRGIAAPAQRRLPFYATGVRPFDGQIFLRRNPAARIPAKPRPSSCLQGRNHRRQSDANESNTPSFHGHPNDEQTRRPAQPLFEELLEEIVDDGVAFGVGRVLGAVGHGDAVFCAE